MQAQPLPVQWHGKLAVVTLPEEIDMPNGIAVQEGLRSALSQRPAALVVDMTPTIFCDSARDAGCELRLVISSPGVMRVFSIIGADQLAEVHSGLASALHATAAQGPDANWSNGHRGRQQGAGSNGPASPGGQ